MSDTEREIELSAIPSMTSMLLRAATARKPATRNPEFSPLKVTASGIGVDQERLLKFCQVCDFNTLDTLPITYPHIMAFALHMQLMLEPEFPFTPMGAVHVRNRIRAHRALLANETLDFCVRFGAAEKVAKGYEVSLITEVKVAGELVWDDLSVMLIRKGGDGAKQEKKGDREKPVYEESLQWQLAANKGRQYAAASGDYNPIHLYPLTAKMMGFKRQIMHGMWSKSRCVAQLMPAQDDTPVTIDVAFKLPIFLPATLTLQYSTNDSGSTFELKDGEGRKPHLAGKIIWGAGAGPAV